MAEPARSSFRSIDGGAIRATTGALPDRRIIDEQGQLDLDAVAVPSREAVLTDQVVDLRRQLNASRQENTRLRKLDVDAETIMERLERWQAKCHPRAKIPVEGKRWKVVKARLADGYTAEELDRVIDIAAELPFEQFGRRYCEAGQGRVRRDDLVFLFADETRVDRLLASTSDETHEEYKAFVWQALQEAPQVCSVLAMLAGREPHGEVLAAAAVWARRQAGS